MVKEGRGGKVEGRTMAGRSKAGRHFNIRRVGYNNQWRAGSMYKGKGGEVEGRGSKVEGRTRAGTVGRFN